MPNPSDYRREPSEEYSCEEQQYKPATRTGLDFCQDSVHFDFFRFAFVHLAFAAFRARSLAVGVPEVFGPPIFPPLLPIVLKNSLTALLARAMAANINA
jgi:hypothetical protein